MVDKNGKIVNARAYKLKLKSIEKLAERRRGRTTFENTLQA